MPLRLREHRQVYLLAGECRRLGSDPIIWRRHMLEQLNELLGGAMAVGGEAAPPAGPDQEWGRWLVDVGCVDPHARDVYRQRISSRLPDDDPFTLAMFAQKGTLPVKHRRQIVDDKTWFGSRLYAVLQEMKCDDMLGSPEVIRVKIHKALWAWSLTTLPFALALVTPRTKLVLSSEDAHSPFRASGGQPNDAGYLPQRSTSVALRTLELGLLRWLGCVPVLVLHHPPRPRQKEEGGGLGEGPGDAGPSPKALLGGAAFLLQSTRVEILFTLE